MKSILILFFLFSLTSKPISDHDIHLSVVRLSMEEPEMIDLTVQVFLDDLMNSVGLVPGEPLPDDYTSADDLLQKFVHDHLIITINDSIIQPIYVENVSSTPAVWITYEITHPTKPIESIHIQNKIMLNLFDDQLNMVHIELPNHTSAHQFDSKTTSATIIL